MAFDTATKIIITAQDQASATLGKVGSSIERLSGSAAGLGALKNARSFRGTAALKTWVFAILKNKIADTLRQRQRLVYAGSLLATDDDEEDVVEALAEHRGLRVALITKRRETLRCSGFFHANNLGNVGRR